MKKHLLTLATFALFQTFLSAEIKSIGTPTNTNFPMDAEGRVYHLGLKKGEVANRILLVGDPNRAKLIAELLDNPEQTFILSSSRGFTTYTGTKEGVRITIMSIGMGLPMMDFAIREIRAITEGPLSVIRLGSCGTPHENVNIGTLVVANESFCVRANYDAYHIGNGSYFNVSHSLLPDAQLHSQLVNELSDESRDTFPVVEMTDATADFFYGSQGRLDPNFEDQNFNLIDSLLAKHPNTGSLQMETYQLFHLAALANYAKQDSMKVAACAIVLAQRKSGAFLSNEEKHELEVKSGKACLKALINSL